MSSSTILSPWRATPAKKTVRPTLQSTWTTPGIAARRSCRWWPGRPLTSSFTRSPRSAAPSISKRTSPTLPMAFPANTTSEPTFSRGRTWRARSPGRTTAGRSASRSTSLGPAPHEVLAVIPLYAGELPSGVLAPTVPFTVPSGTQSARLEYRTSGHGQGRIGIGCIGPAEEFCRRIQHVYVDRAMVKTVDPWRECDALCTPAHYGPMAGGIDYCLENPCGNMNSVRAPRANWCPGSMTPPFAWKDIAPLEVPGPHTFTFDVSTILPDGSWQVSAIYYAFGAR